MGGWGLRFGWFPALLMVPYATFIPKGAVAAIGTAYGVVVARRFGAPPVLNGDHFALSVAAAVAVIFSAMMGAAAALSASPCRPRSRTRCPSRSS